MKPSPDFEPTLIAWLDERAQPYAPQHLLDASVARTSRTRQRPAWLIPERWIPMPLTLRLAVVPRAVIILMILSALLAIAIAGASVGGRLDLLNGVTPLPATGPAGNGLIAYDSAGDIWVVNQDGKNPSKLIQGPALEHSPVWSRDGQRLAYWSQDSATSPSRLMTANSNASDPKIIFTDPAGRVPYTLDWSPDGKSVAFSLDWSPDGNSLCTAAGPLCYERVFVVPTDGTDASGAAPVSAPGLTAGKPMWSPRGDKLAFSANRAGVEQGVYLMAPDGSGSPQRISTTIDDQPYSFFTVGWSADGKSIVTQAGTTDSDIYVVPADGTGDRNLTQQPGIDGIPKWSPDDTKVAYLKGMNLLAIVPATGGPSQSLGSISGTPTWSPDGTKLAVGQSMGSAAISVVDAVSGTVLARIATPDQSFPAQAHYPSWQRVAP